jgi:hypothetical protein
VKTQNIQRVILEKLNESLADLTGLRKPDIVLKNQSYLVWGSGEMPFEGVNVGLGASTQPTCLAQFRVSKPTVNCVNAFRWGKA